MKALTIKQPWASLIMAHGKDVENRTWKTKYRGPLVIHASKSFDFDAMREMQENFDDVDYELPAGACLGIVDVVDCSYFAGPVESPPGNGLAWCHVALSKWHQARFYGWLLANVRPFPKPVPYTGHQSLWNIPDEEVEAMIRGEA